MSIQNERILGNGQHGKVVAQYFPDYDITLATKTWHEKHNESSECDYTNHAMWTELYAASIVGSSPHPNIMSTFSLHIENEKPLLSMPLIHPGWDAYNLKQSYGISYNQVLYMFRELLFGVHHLHTLQLVHNDIRTQNVLLQLVSETDASPRYRLVLLDFGTTSIPHTVRLAPYSENDTPFTPPETFTTNSSPSTDAWYLGMLLLHMVATYDQVLELMKDVRILYSTCSDDCLPSVITRWLTMHTDMLSSSGTWKHFVSTVSVLLRHNPHQRKSLMHICSQTQYLGCYTTDTSIDIPSDVVRTELSQVYRTIDYTSCGMYNHRINVVQWMCNLLVCLIGNNVCLGVIRDGITLWEHVSSEGNWDTVQLSSLAGACLFISTTIHVHGSITNMSELAELCGSSVHEMHCSFKRILQYITDAGFPTAPVNKMQDAYQQLQHILDPQDSLDEPWLPTMLEQALPLTHPYATLAQAVHQKKVNSDVCHEQITG